MRVADGCASSASRARSAMRHLLRMLDLPVGRFYVRILRGGVRMANETGSTLGAAGTLPTTGAPVLRRRGRRRGGGRLAGRLRGRLGGGGGSSGPQKTGGILTHGATGGSSKDTLDAHAPVTNPDIARVFNLYEPLLFWDNNYRARARRSRSPSSLQGRHDLDGQAAPGRHLPQRQARHAGRRARSRIQRVANPKAPTLRGRRSWRRSSTSPAPRSRRRRPRW